MPDHSTLTGADLHEPKGVSSASAGTVYISNGSGSGSWLLISDNSINLASIKNLNRQFLTIDFPDIGTAGSRYLTFPKACRVEKIGVVLQGATATADTLLTFRNDAGTSMGTINLSFPLSAGAVSTVTPVSNNTFTADQKMQIDTDGGTSTTPGAVITLELVWT